MKKLMTLIGIVSILTFLSCNKNEMEPTKGVVKPEPCCSVTCEDGSCSAYGAPCNCSCSWLGAPKCNGTAQSVIEMPDSLFDGREHVTLDKDFLDKVKKDQEILYSLHLPYATEIADAQNSYSTLIQKHGYVLTTRQALIDYYTIVEKVERLFNELSREQQKMLDEAIDAGKSK